MTSQTFHHYELALQQLNELTIPDPDLEPLDEATVATNYAYISSLNLLTKLIDYFSIDFPYCSITLTSKGGIDLVWDRLKPCKRIWVSVPHDSSLQGSIYSRCEPIRNTYTFINGLVLEDLVKELSKFLK